MIGVNINGYRPEKVKTVMTKEKLTWRSFADVRGGEGETDTVRPIVEQWNLQGTPTLYLIDHQGVIRYRWVGSTGTKTIDMAVQSLIKNAEEDAKKGAK